MVHSSGQSIAPAGSKQGLSLLLANNTFWQFNFLKDYSTEGDITGSRNSPSSAFTGLESSKAFGIIVDLTEGFRDGTLVFWNNTVKDLVYFYKQVA